MSRRVVTIFDHAFPDSPEWSEIAGAWSDEIVESMLTLVWEGFDRMKAKILSKVDFSQALHQLERTLTDAHATEIILLWKANRTGFESFLPKPEMWEPSSIANPSAMPPSYDIGFENVNDPRLRWPVEGKVLHQETDVVRYLDDLRKKYLSGIGAPYSTQAALFGYLRSGQPEKAIAAVSSSLGVKLLPFSRSGRVHHTSSHKRAVPTLNGGASHDFCCHHMIGRIAF